NHDDGRTLDPFLGFTAPSTGVYVLQVFGFAYPADSDVRFTGNARCVYRLQVHRGPYAHHTVPLGVSRRGRTHLQVVGWNLGRAGPASERGIDFDGAPLPAGVQKAALRSQLFENELLLPVGDGTELTEKEPNETVAEAGRCEPPFAVTGRIDRPGDEDRFLVAAKKGQTLRCEVQSAWFGFPVDAWMKIENRAGRELKRSDDNTGVDPMLEWSPPEDGDYVVAIGDVLHRGGPDHWDRLGVAAVSPSLRVTAKSSAFTFEAGQTNELKVTVKLLNGAKGKFTTSVQGLPEGVAVEPVAVPEGGGEATLKAVVPPEA